VSADPPAAAAAEPPIEARLISLDPAPAGRTWYSSMSGRERRTFWGCFAGWSLDAFYVQLYSLAIPVLLTIGFLADTNRLA